MWQFLLVFSLANSVSYISNIQFDHWTGYVCVKTAEMSLDFFDSELASPCRPRKFHLIKEIRPLVDSPAGSNLRYLRKNS